MDTFANTMQTTSNILATITMTFYSGSFKDAAAAHEMQRGDLLHSEENLDDNDTAVYVTSKNYWYCNRLFEENLSRKSVDNLWKINCEKLTQILKALKYTIVMNSLRMKFSKLSYTRNCREYSYI